MIFQYRTHLIYLLTGFICSLQFTSTAQDAKVIVQKADEKMRGKSSHVLQHFFLKEKAWNGVLHNSFIRFRYSF